MRKLPLLWTARAMRPAMGARFTWQLNTFMKMETRVTGMSGSPSSRGGMAWPMAEILPSAGLMTKSSLTGVTRCGSRKNSAHQMVRPTPSQNRVVEK